MSVVLVVLLTLGLVVAAVSLSRARRDAEQERLTRSWRRHHD